MRSACSGRSPLAVWSGFGGRFGVGRCGGVIFFKGEWGELLGFSQPKKTIRDFYSGFFVFMDCLMAAVGCCPLLQLSEVYSLVHSCAEEPEACASSGGREACCDHWSLQVFASFSNVGHFFLLMTFA